MATKKATSKAKTTVPKAVEKPAEAVVETPVEAPAPKVEKKIFFVEGYGNVMAASTEDAKRIADNIIRRIRQ